MNDKLQRCSNCSAYMMSEDDICPRCDADMRQDAPAAVAPPTVGDPAKTDMFATPTTPPAT
ncbi:MAG: hypothetical protein K8S97_06500, partial [Anaerolineae bacterium]|nr:hypothetical protein [Anaerolineae bacterium]